MCKTPGGNECEPVDHDLPVGDDGESSADDTEPINTDSSYMSDSSMNDDLSDSDAESCSGNRVTSTMIIWHLMKEKGLITLERYNEMQEKVDDECLKNLFPKVPCYSSGEHSCNDNSFSFNIDDDESTDDYGGGVESDIEKDDHGTDDVTDVAETAKDLKNEEGSSSVKNLNDGSKEPSNENAIDLNPNMETVGKKSEETDAFEQNKLPNEQESEISKDAVNGPAKILFNTILDTIKQAFTSDKSISSKEDPLNKEAKSDGLINKKQDDLEETAFETQVVAERSEKETDKALMSDKEACNLGAEKELHTVETNNNNCLEITEQNTEYIKKETGSADLKSKFEINEQTEKKRTESIENIIIEIMNKKLILEDNVAVLETYVKDLDDFYDRNRAVEKFSYPNKTLREFTLFLHFYSPSAYKYIRETFSTPIPGHRVLSTWYLQDDDRPGLAKKAFSILKRKASGGRLLCTLMSHAVFLTNYGLNYDQVDFGGGSNYEFTDKASMAFVFVLVGLDKNWKIPIGYFLARSVPAETQAALIRVCLTQCYEAGADVVCVTLDTLTPAEFLGCSLDDVRNLKTTFKHPECDYDVAVWIDPCLAFRSIHHILNSKGELLYDEDKKVRWNLIRKLRRLYSKDIIDFEEYHSPRSLILRNHIAKVGLTSAILSESLAPALNLCEELLPNMFKDSAPTRKFIEVLNKLYVTLNSKPTDDSGVQRPMDANSYDLLLSLDEAKAFIIDLFCNKWNMLSIYEENPPSSFVEGKPASGFVAFLFCIESTKHLFDSLVKMERVGRLATHRLCKDHVEDFVKNMRRNRNVDPNDFTGWDFRCFYNEILDHLDRNPHLSDENVPLEHYPIENRFTPAVAVKVTAGKRAYDEDYSFQYRPKKLPKTSHEARATKIVRGYSVALDTEGELGIRKHMVGYLAGWIAAKLAKHLKCEECVDALLSDEKLWFHKYITLKELKGVCLPSEELFRVCWECERAVRSGRARPAGAVLRGLASRFPWARRRARHHPTHHVHLVRAIIAKYIPLRVAVPFSSEAKKRVTQMLGLIECMHSSGLFRDIYPSEFIEAPLA